MARNGWKWNTYGSDGRDRDLRPGIVDRARMAWAPGWRRTLTLRRLAAVALVAAAVALMLRGDPGGEQVDVVVASHDLAPGVTLGPSDLTVARRAARAAPEGALSGIDAAVGHTVAAPVRTGEVLTDVRVLGASLAASAAGVADARLVTVRLADPALAEVVREGDLVDIIAAGPEDSGVGHGFAGGGGIGAVDTADADHAGTAGRSADPAPRGITLARRAPVVLVPDAPAGRTRRGRVLLVALPADTAATVASASMTRALTVTVR